MLEPSGEQQSHSHSPGLSLIQGYDPASGRRSFNRFVSTSCANMSKASCSKTCGEYRRKQGGCVLTSGSPSPVTSGWPFLSKGRPLLVLETVWLSDAPYNKFAPQLARAQTASDYEHANGTNERPPRRAHMAHIPLKIGSGDVVNPRANQRPSSSV